MHVLEFGVQFSVGHQAPIVIISTALIGRFGNYVPLWNKNKVPYNIIAAC